MIVYKSLYMKNAGPIVLYSYLLLSIRDSTENGELDKVMVGSNSPVKRSTQFVH